MKRMLMMSALVTATATSLYADGKGHVRAGSWHTSVKTEIPGAPFTPPPTEIDRCVTAEEASDPQKMLKKQQDDCEAASVKLDGSHLTYTVTCHKHGGTQTGTGELTFAGESYSGTMTLTMNDPRRGPMKIIQHIQANRTGDCTP